MQDRHPCIGSWAWEWPHSDSELMAKSAGEPLAPQITPAAEGSLFQRPFSNSFRAPKFSLPEQTEETPQGTSL